MAASSIVRCRCGHPLIAAIPGDAPPYTAVLCPHCDTVNPLGPCGRRCAACFARDSHCPICRVDCGTPTAARAHETACRQRETSWEAPR